MRLTWMNRYTMPEFTALSASIRDGYGKRFVTDGRGLLVVDDPEANAGPPKNVFTGSKRDLHHAALCRAITNDTPESAAVGNLMDFWAWLDGFGLVWCPEFHYEFHSELCHLCEGNNWFHTSAEDRSVISIGGLPFDRDMVAWWMPSELLDIADGDGSFRYWLWESRGTSCVSFVGRGWRVVIASLMKERFTDRYREYVLGCGPLWMNRNDIGARAAYVDWVQEQGYDELAAFGQSEVSHATMATH